MTDMSNLAALLKNEEEEEVLDETSDEADEEKSSEEEVEKEEVEKEEKPENESLKDLELPEKANLLPGLILGEKIDPPVGFDSAYQLNGTLQFIGGRKHDPARNMVALGMKNGEWVYIVRTAIHFSCEMLRTSTTQLDKWLASL